MVFTTGTTNNAKQMAMRIYSGDERMALELSMDSPKARTFAGRPRLFRKPNYDRRGQFQNLWYWLKWSGDTKEIIVKQDAVVPPKVSRVPSST